MKAAHFHEFQSNTEDGRLDLEMPEGWIMPKLGEILTANYGKGLKKSSRESGPIPVYGSNGMLGKHNNILTQGPTIILGRKGTVGAVNFSSVPCWPIDTTYFIDEFNGLVPEYLFHVLRSLNLAELDTSTAIPGLNRNDLYSQHIPLPPIYEQRRIVAKVEELLARVNAARDRLANVKEILNRFRQSVLAAACSGRLTADWRESHKDITLAEVSIQEIFSLRQKQWTQENGPGKKYKPPRSVPVHDLPVLPEGWKYVSSDALFLFVTSGSRGWAKYYSEAGPSFIRVGNLDHDTITLDLSQTQHVFPPRGAECERTQIRDGDILISITADVGMIGLVPDGMDEAYVNQHVAISRPVEGVYRPFLAWYLASQEGGQSQFQDLQRGATKVGLVLDDIRSVAVPFPPIEEQHKIVRRVEELFKLSDAIEKRVAAAEERAQRLKQAILAKAFRGELVPTEAELARREGRSYEPASDLLAKIEAQRKDVKPQRKGQNAEKGLLDKNNVRFQILCIKNHY